MRNISFSMTTEAFKNRQKTVTRRLGWKNLKPGEILMGCEKCQGLKKGEKVKKLGAIRVVKVDREPLDDVRLYGRDECIKEGFPDLTTYEFVSMFAEHNKCDYGRYVTRIEFEYLEA